ncbi:EcoKI restriction-modification system protein HsdS [bacterium BMS3Abin15]|nr:EcoKI restriction-modification system protein HsdS [bacterium BMS3Abin15]
MKKGWEISSIGDVCERTFNINWNNENGPRKYIDLSTVSRETFTVIECQVVNSQNAPSRAKKIISDNDVLFATTRPTLRRVTIIEDKYNNALCSTGFTVLRPQKARVLAKWLFNILITDGFMEYIEKRQKGASYPAVTDNDVKKFIIPVPPLPEQKRIVKILDKAFQAIDKAKANAEKNLQNAQELFESYLNGVFANPGEDWEEKMLGEVCEVIGGGTPSKANSKFYNGDINWATVRDMKNEIINDTEYKITVNAVKNSSTNIIPRNNVIIATRVGLGKICLIENDTAINQDLRGVIPIHPNKLSVNFLYRWFKFIAPKIVEEGTGATVQGVKLPFIKSLIIFFPSLKKQKAIVLKLDTLSTETKRLDKIYQQKIADTEELKKSILKKAFEGEL